MSFLSILFAWLMIMSQYSAALHKSRSIEEKYLNILFKRYGNGQSMLFEAFEQLLDSIGLTQFKVNSTHRYRTDQTTSNVAHNNIYRHVTVQRNNTSPATRDKQTSLKDKGCLQAGEIFALYNVDQKHLVGRKLFRHICPLLVEQIDSKICWHKGRQSKLVEYERQYRHPNIKKQSTTQHFAALSLNDEAAIQPAVAYSKGHSHARRSSNSTGPASIPPKVWIFSTVAVVVISLVGLAAVALVPCLQNFFYNHLIQFLVALAVGSLTGDAMLHLLPHAIVNSAMSEVHFEEHDEQATVFKGLVALCGVYFFFMAEKVLALISEFRAERKQIQEDMKRHEETGMEAAILRRASRVPAYGSNDDFLLAPGLGGKALRSIDNLKRYLEDDYEHATHETNDNLEKRIGHSSTENSPKHKMEDRLNPNFSQKSSSDIALIEPEVKIILPDDDKAAKTVNSSAVEPPSGGSQGHGHGHSHGTEVPDSVAAVAWMVILGDGLHNFSDGLAIGAAFANGLAGGFSTSIAVFCHELPHELGDFAVLLKTGMKIKQALLYNMMSSVLCLVGMLIGVCIGNIQSASYWIFAITGGMFIYISLVDMLPELNLINVKPGESRIVHFVIQNAGILTGISIMLVIALYEEDIKVILG